MIIIRHFNDYEDWEAKEVSGPFGGGYLLAAMNGEDIHILHSIKEMITHMKGHLEDEGLLEALNDAGIIDIDDDGEYVI